MQSASEYCSPARGRNETVEVTSEIARRLGGAAVVLELVRNEMGRCERGGSYIMKRCVGVRVTVVYDSYRGCQQ